MREFARQHVEHATRHPWRVLAVAILFAAWCLLVWWGLDRAPPRTDITGTAFGRAATPEELLDPDYLPVVGRGEEFQGVWRMTISRLDCSGVARRWVSSVSDPEWRLELPTTDIADWEGLEPPVAMPTRRKVDVAQWHVPDYAPLGEAAYHVSALFVCNPLHRLMPIRVDYPVMRFRIVEKVAARPHSERR